MSTRTQIYLDENQRRALKMIAASTDSTMSDLVRRAINRLLADEFAGKHWASEIRIAVDRIRESVPAMEEHDLDKLAAARRRIASEKSGDRVREPRAVKTIEKHKVRV